MARLLVFVLCASMVTTQRNGNVVKSEKGELKLNDQAIYEGLCKSVASFREC